MTYRLHTDALDEGPKTLDYPTPAEAIDGAVAWFIGGYEEDLGEDLTKDVARLREDLTAGREFYCGKFYERARIEAP